MKAIVLAGGLGTRLRSLQPDVPKPMVAVGGRPFLAYVLDRLVAGGLDDFVLSVGYLANVVQAHFGTAYRGIAIRYSVEDEPLGTGGATALALRGEKDEPVLVLNGDSYLALDFRALISWYLQDPVSVAMVLKRVPDVARYGAVLTANGRATGFSEKGLSGPGLISAGVYILRPDALARAGLGGKFSLETDFLQRYSADLLPRVFVCDGYFIDIGVPEDLERAQRELPAQIAATVPGAAGAGALPP